MQLQEAGVVEPLLARDPNRMSLACASMSTTEEVNKESMHNSATTSKQNIKEPMQINRDPNFSMVEIPTEVLQVCLVLSHSHCFTSLLKIHLYVNGMSEFCINLYVN